MTNRLRPIWRGLVADKWLTPNPEVAFHQCLLLYEALLQTLQFMRAMIDKGATFAVMINHELNSI